MKKIICRLCLFPVSKATSLKEDITVHGKTICTSTALTTLFPNLTQLQIKESDNSCVPDYICNICLHHLDTLYRFWQQCEQSNTIILNILEEHKTLETNSSSNSYHSQYNLLNCDYYKNSKNIKKEISDSLEVFYKNSNMVNEIVICEEIKDIKQENDSVDKEKIEESQEMFLEYLNLKVINEPLNSCNGLNSLSWEHYFKTTSSVLKKTDLINYKLDHDYSKEFSKYQCPLCQKSFVAESVLHIHFETSHYNVRHRCTKCGQQCLSHFDLLNHTRFNHPCYQCKICKKNYLSISKFEIHVKRNHNGYEPFECKLCSKTYVMKGLLLKHEKLEHSIYSTSSKRLLCQFCNRTFVSKGGLEWHTEVKHGSKIAHECDICSSKFSNSGSLMKHMKRHKSFKPINCILCDKACPSMMHLQEHIKYKHQTQSIYVCELCDITCFKEADLISHIQTHTGEI